MVAVSITKLVGFPYNVRVSRVYMVSVFEAGTLAVGQADWSASFDVQHSMPGGVLRLTQVLQGANIAHSAQPNVHASCRGNRSSRCTAPNSALVVM